MLNIDENDPRLLEIFNHYGDQHQRLKCAEECMELMAATFRYAQIDLDLSLSDGEKAAERQKQLRNIESEITPKWIERFRGKLTGSGANNTRNQERIQRFARARHPREAL